MDELQLLIDRIAQKLNEYEEERNSIAYKYQKVLETLKEKLKYVNDKEKSLLELAKKIDTYLRYLNEIKDKLEVLENKVEEMDKAYNHLIGRIEEINKKVFNIESRLIRIEKWMTKQ